MVPIIKNKFNVKISIKKLRKVYSKINYTRKKVKRRIIKNEKFLDTETQERDKFIKKINCINSILKT